MKYFQTIKSGQRFLQQEIIKVTWHKNWQKWIYLGLIGVQAFAYVGIVFDNSKY